jgi:putative CocE/NonD family hydrolase
VKIRTEFPRPIRVIDTAWIKLSDSTRIAARVWLPVDAETDPVPAIVEYLPYRKNDATAARDAEMHPYFAGFGYAAIRIDMRGSGDSDGIMYDEYLKQEQDDALEAFKWIAAQSWCTGKIGIIGKSWGGFNGLQIAARRPPELKAVVTVASTDDRYGDDVHYIGGGLLPEGISWAAVMLAYNARPPDPARVGERWREMWFKRMDETPPFIEAWVTHQRRDAFWRHGSICDSFADVECPVYAVGGWTDGYTSPVLRMLDGLAGPRKGLIGPWGHLYPQDGVPGPAIGFLQECIRWWDHWLKDTDTGIMDEPMLRLWTQDSTPPAVFYAQRPGRWVSEATWPSTHVQPQRLMLSARTLSSEGGPPETQRIRGVQAAGLLSGVWSAFGRPGDLPPDQRQEDGLSLCFDTEPLAESMEILGFPTVTLKLTSDQPSALITARLCDVEPTGASTLMTRGFLNLTHRDSHEFPEPLEPGKEYTISFPLKAVGQTIAAGNRIRLGLSPTYWPYAWPSPVEACLTIHTGGESFIELPVRSLRAGESEPPRFEEAEASTPLENVDSADGAGNRRIYHDAATGSWAISVGLGFDSLTLSDGLTYSEQGGDTFSIVEGDPLSAKADSAWTISIGRDTWQTRVETQSTLSGDAESFHLTNRLDAYEGNARVFSKTWTKKIPRDNV